MKKHYFTIVAALMCLLMPMAASAEDWYLVGEYNGWGLGTAKQFAYDESSDTWSLHLDALQSSFKLLNQNTGWQPQWGAEGSNKVTVGQPFALYHPASGDANNILFENTGEVTNADLVIAKAGEGYTLTITGDYQVQEKKWYVCGAFQNWNAGEAPEMTLNESTGCYELAVASLTSGLKIINAQGWGQGEWGAAISTPLQVGEPMPLSDTNGGDVIFFYEEIADALLSIDPTTGVLTVTGTAGAPKYPTLVLVGSFSSWSTGSSPTFTVDDATGIYTLDEEALSAYTLTDAGYEMKISTSSWNPQYGTSEAITTAGTYTLTRKLKNDPANMKCTVAPVKKISFNINTCEMTIESATDGLESAMGASQEPVRYYNLQGVEVAYPTAGLYIRRQGTRAEKVLVK